MRIQHGFFAILLCALSTLAPGAPRPSPYFVYVGTYGKGIYGYRYDVTTAKFEAMGMAAAIADPSFLATDPKQHFLYAVSELPGANNPIGGVAAFSLDRKTGSLKPINSVSSEGNSPCHLATDQTGKLLLVANYGSGSVSVYPIGEDGALGKASQVLKYSGSSVQKDRQEGSHAHEVVISTDNQRAFVPDLGLDQIHVLRLDPTLQKVTADNPPFIPTAPGTGPRHMVLNPNGKFAYVLSELKSIVTAYSYQADSATFKPLQSASTLPEHSSAKNNPAELVIDSTGKFLYASNRGDDSIAVFAIDRGTGKLTQIQVAPTQGKMPRAFVIDPSGKHLLAANQQSDKIVVFDINPKNGRISPTGQIIDVPSPVCITFIPADVS